MKIKLTSVFVDDQDKALKFYTDVLGFVKKLDFPTITNFHQNNDLFIMKDAALWPWAPAEALRAREVA